MCVLGYPMGQKRFKLYDLKNEKMYTNRNVTIVDIKFLFGDKY